MNRALPSVVVRCLAAALLLGAGACTKAPQAPPPSHPSPLQAQTLPDFEKQTLTGATLDTAALRGQVLVVKFFAKYCEPCKVTLPAAEKLHTKYDDVVVIGISEDERSADAEAVVAEYGLTFPVVLDRSRSLAGRFRVAEIPMTFVIDRQGVVQWVGGPGQTEEGLESAIAMVR